MESRWVMNLYLLRKPKQFDRLAAIFKELKADVQFLPVEIGPFTKALSMKT
jgi:hypothetical protein